MSKKEAHTSLKKDQLGFFEVVALSVAIIAPTFASSMNLGMMVSSAGSAIGFVFIISVFMLLCVAFSFVKFGQRVASAGSAYTYVKAGLGDNVSTVTGWGLLLAYFTFTSGCSSAFGYLFSAFIKEVSGVSVPWIYLAVLGIVAIWLITYYDIQLSTRIMLFVELASTILLVVVAIFILTRVAAKTGISAMPFKLHGAFMPDGSAVNAAGIGGAIVPAVLCFGGFEGAASLGEESRNPKKYIPLAILSTVIFAGAIFIIMAWAEMNGFGLTKAGLTKFANSGSSVVELSDMYTNNAITILVTLAIVVSAFSTALGSMTASTRMLYELAKEHKAPAVFARVHQKHNTPYTSDHTIFVIALIPPIAMYAASHGALSGTDVFGTVATVGILGLILTYGLTCLSSVVYFTRLRDGKREWTWQVIFPIIAIAVMAYCFYGNLAGNSLAIITFIVLIAGFIVTKVYQHRADYSAAASAKQAKAAAKNGQIM
mgnify:CR=1 FL=1|jgi:amino acid transporter